MGEENLSSEKAGQLPALYIANRKYFCELCTGHPNS